MTALGKTIPEYVPSDSTVPMENRPIRLRLVAGVEGGRQDGPEAPAAALVGRKARRSGPEGIVALVAEHEPGTALGP